tara:strand:- start:6325 stop:7413 length:1089 start_codon:yes stop_codon:yes gene_type:complete
MGKFNIKNFAYYFPILLFLNSIVLPVRASSALAAWSFRSDGVLELRTKSKAKLKAYFQKANKSFGDRFWIDFKGELINPRIIKGNGPIKEIRLGKPNQGQTRLVIEFNKDKSIDPYNLELVGISDNKWKIKLASFKKNSFKTISEGDVSNPSSQIVKRNNFSNLRTFNIDASSLPNVKRNKFYVVIDPGHGGIDAGAIGIRGLRETDVVLDVSKTVQRLLSKKGVNVRLTRKGEIDLDLSPRVTIANRTGADIFVSIHANASRGKKKDINGLETFYYSGWRGKLLAEKIQQEIIRVSPGSPDRGVRSGRYFVIRKTNMPAVLVEIGFVTGKLDARRLEKPLHRKRVAYAIAKGILKYLQRVG